jgi:endonuclease-3 related protein
LKALIRPSGFTTRKAPALKAFVAMLDEEFGGSLDTTGRHADQSLRSRLLALPGVGPETADAILLYALNHPVPVVDEYLRRIAVRHGLANPHPGRKGYENWLIWFATAFASEDRQIATSSPKRSTCSGCSCGQSHCRKSANCEGCPLKPELRSGFPRIRA